MGNGWQVKVTTGSVLLYFCVLSVICGFFFFFLIFGVGKRRERETWRKREHMCVFLGLFLSLDLYGVWRSYMVCDMLRGGIWLEYDSFKEIK